MSQAQKAVMSAIQLQHISRVIILLVILPALVFAQRSKTVRVDTLSPYQDSVITFDPPLAIGATKTSRAGTDSLRSDIDTLRARVDSLTASIDTLGAKTNLLKAELEAIYAWLDAFDARLDALELTIGSIVDDLAALNAKFDALTTRYNLVLSTVTSGGYYAFTADSVSSDKISTVDLYITDGSTVYTLAEYITEYGGGDSTTTVGWVGGILGVRARATDSTNTSGVLQEDGALYALMGGTLDHGSSLSDGSIWVGYYDLFFNVTPTSGTEQGVKIALTTPDPGYTITDVGIDYVITPGANDSAYAVPFTMYKDYADSTTYNLYLTRSGNPANYSVRVNFWVNNVDGEAGYLKLLWASYNSDATLLRGSNLVAYRIY